MKINDLADLGILKECLSETDLVSEDTNHDKEDIEIKCINCGKVFVFTVGEQQFYASKNFPAPKHCRECSKKRRLKFLNYK